MPLPQGTYRFRGCFEVTCGANPDEHDARVALEEYGLHQVTNDASGQAVPRIEGELLVWGAHRYADQRNFSGAAYDILGFNISTGEFLVIAGGVDYHQTTPEVNGGRVLYRQEPLATAPDAGQPAYMVLWDSHTMNRTRVQTGMPGDVLPVGLEDEWVLFWDFSSNATYRGLWAFHLKTGEKEKLYTPTSPPKSNKEPTEVLTQQSLAGGRVFYSLVRQDPVNQTGNSTIYEYDLANRTARVFYSASGYQINELHASEQVVTWEASIGNSLEVWYSERGFPNAKRISEPSDRYPQDCRTRGNWVAFYSHARGVLAFNVRTNQTATLLPETESFSYTFGSGLDTDGARVAMLVNRNDPRYDHLWSDIYWAQIPAS